MVSSSSLEMPCHVDIPNVVFINALGGPSGTNLHPRGAGVDFGSTEASMSFVIAPGVTAIITQVTVPTRNTNVDQIIVSITAPDGTVTFGPSNSTGGNTVTGFPTHPLPTGSTVIIALCTSDGQPPQNVTLDVTACYTVSGTVGSTAAATTVPGTDAPTDEATDGMLERASDKFWSSELLV